MTTDHDGTDPCDSNQALVTPQPVESGRQRDARRLIWAAAAAGDLGAEELDFR
jgi:hypothetical protein